MAAGAAADVGALGARVRRVLPARGAVRRARGRGGRGRAPRQAPALRRLLPRRRHTHGRQHHRHAIQ